MVGVRSRSFTFSQSVGVRHLRIATPQRTCGGNIIAKMADCRSDVELNIARTTKTIGD